MKAPVAWLDLAFMILVSSASGQGTFVYDQQSSVEGVNGEGSVNIQSNAVGQSFTPTLSAVEFIRLRVLSFGSGGQLYVNLRENSITGNVLAVSSLVSIPGSIVGYTNFVFPTPATVTPGMMYFFEPVAQSGTGWFVGVHNGFNYSGGTAILNGVADRFNYDLWFREGLYIPEPSAAALGVLGAAWLAWLRRSRRPLS